MQFKVLGVTNTINNLQTQILKSYLFILHSALNEKTCVHQRVNFHLNQFFQAFQFGRTKFSLPTTYFFVFKQRVQMHYMTTKISQLCWHSLTGTIICRLHHSRNIYYLQRTLHVVDCLTLHNVRLIRVQV